ncbi:hypothetical protein GHT06_020830 [Daphnia sinensis]|uniref:Uncharacterized protein n=1 Tax=Daphnia sinensis TaxID=1820382 RepID=A0AAD5PS04_9CRUS|nr:hypothetical protein GHT06_020830 [Daphnia sinensis]
MKIHYLPQVVFLASIFVFATYSSVCHGLPTPEADPYRYKTAIDIRQAVVDWGKVETVDKPYYMGFPEENGKEGPTYPDTFFGAYRMNPNYRTEEEPLVLLLEQVPKQTPYSPIPYAVYYQLSADDVAIYDNGISY